MLQNKIRYLAILVTAGLLAVLYNEYFMGILFLTIAVLPFLLFALLSYIYGRVSAELVSLIHVANKGESFPVSVQLNNPTIFPVSNIGITLTYSNSFSKKHYRKEFMVSIDRRAVTTVSCNLMSEHSGNLDIGLSKVKIYDFLKMFHISRKNLGEVKVAILPKFYEISEDYLANRSGRMVESDYYSQVKKGDDPSEVFAIREYREGDKPTRIHWKLSSKQDQLMIKEFSEPLNCSVLVLIDLSNPKEENVLDYMDAILECSLSIAYSFLQTGQLHYLAWFDEQLGACRRIRVVQERDLYEAVDLLLQSGPCREGLDAAASYLAEHPNDQYTDLFYVTGEVCGSKLEALSMLKASVRQILYINDMRYDYGGYDTGKVIRLPLAEELVRKIADMGIGLQSIDAGNIKGNLEQLKLG